MPENLARTALLSIIGTRRSLLVGLGGLGALGVPMPVQATEEQRDLQAFERAVLFGLAPFEFARTGWLAAAPTEGRPSRYNRIVARPSLLDETSRTVTTPNADTLYSSIRLDLSQGPIEVRLPPVSWRYVSLAIMDAFTEVISVIHPHHDGSRIIVVGPQGQALSGASEVLCPTADAWALLRVEVAGPDDLAAARAIQAGLSLSAPPAAPFPVEPVRPLQAGNFVAVLNAVLARTGRFSSYRRRAESFRVLGVEPRIDPGGAPLTPAQVQGFTAALPRVLETLRSGWSAAGQSVGGWSLPTPNLGLFGEDDRARAATALNGLAALPLDEATYYTATTDEAGAPLRGEVGYRMDIPAKTPAGAFWSVSAYRPDPGGGWFFAKNPLGRYSIGSHDRRLQRSIDGETPIYIANTEPDGDRDSNWLPAPEGPIELVFRLYNPGLEARAGGWTPPPILRLNPS